MQPIITVEHNHHSFPVPEAALAGPPSRDEADGEDPLEQAFFALLHR